MVVNVQIQHFFVKILSRRGILFHSYIDFYLFKARVSFKLRLLYLLYLRAVKLILSGTPSTFQALYLIIWLWASMADLIWWLYKTDVLKLRISFIDTYYLVFFEFSFHVMSDLIYLLDFVYSFLSIWFYFSDFQSSISSNNLRAVHALNLHPI